MQGYQAMQATAQTAWQSGSDSLSNTSTAETTWKFVWQTLTNTNSSNSKSSNLRQSSGDLSGNGISYEYTADSPRHCWQPLSGLRRLRTRPWPLEGNRWHSSTRLCISKHSTRLSALVCVCFFQEASEVHLLRRLQGRLPRKPVIGGSTRKSARSN